MDSPTATTLDRVSEQALERIAAAPIGGYHADSEPASEPTAWATLALVAAGRTDAARRGAEWLAERQNGDGSVGVTASQDAPGWPTSLAMLAWQAIDSEGYAERVDRGAQWALEQEPWTTPRHRVAGHDTTLEGWSWAPATHSWIEPTAFFAVALRGAGYANHPRRDQAVRLMVDRLLSGGGANYGNTTILGQELLQHLQPSGIVAWALAGEDVDDPRLAKTVDYLRQASAEPTGTASLAWAVRGLAANGAANEAIRSALAQAWPRVERNGGLYRLALWSLAALESSGGDPRNE